MNIETRHRYPLFVIASVLITTLLPIPALAQVSLVKDIRSGADGSTPGFATVLGSKIIFAVDDGVHDTELCKVVQRQSAQVRRQPG